MKPRTTGSQVPTVRDIPKSRKAGEAEDGLDVIDRVLLEAASLRPTPGYINGDDYGQWYVEAPTGLLEALAALAAHRKQPALSSRLERIAGPMCLEVVDDSETSFRVCISTVADHERPCPAHAPENGPALGRCNYADVNRRPYPRMCKDACVEGSDRCAGHDALCRVVKKNGEVCDNANCRTPAHRKARAGQAS
ncbi:hypothetical protein ACE1OC_42940 (plasmid) [Streptomyces sp. DSM 116496]|uniref:hypothetical protein n=1 Tax=Streptomyces stoeckheimensis TaxID=3344656 RepID=UPI0038B38EDC